MKKFHRSALRHAVIRSLLEKDLEEASLQALAARLGHSSLSMTRWYVATAALNQRQDGVRSRLAARQKLVRALMKHVSVFETTHGTCSAARPLYTYGGASHGELPDCRSMVIPRGDELIWDYSKYMLRGRRR